VGVVGLEFFFHRVICEFGYFDGGEVRGERFFAEDASGELEY